jgi:arylesterase / paraoxonase
MLFDVTEDRTAGGATAVALSLRRTIKDPLMHSLNDITLVSHEAFYTTNDHGSETEFGEQLETWLLLPRANVVYYDGSAAKTAASGFNYANGINRNADASEIYVAEATGRVLQTFRRDADTGMLAHIHSLFLGVGPDNLDVDSDGAIWIGAHPRLLDFLAHAEDETKKSPSAVLKVTPAGDDTKFETIYVNMGKQLSGSSVAIAHKGRLVIGPVFDPKFLNCTLK